MPNALPRVRWRELLVRPAIALLLAIGGWITYDRFFREEPPPYFASDEEHFLYGSVGTEAQQGVAQAQAQVQAADRQIAAATAAVQATQAAIAALQPRRQELQTKLAEIERMKTEPVSGAELAKAVKQFTAGTLSTRPTAPQPADGRGDVSHG